MTNTNENTNTKFPKLKNKGFIRGVFIDSEINFGKKTQAGKEFANGWIKVKSGDSILQVRVMQWKMTKNWKSPNQEEIINPNYKGLETFLDKHKSVVDCSKRLDLIKQTEGLSEEDVKAKMVEEGFVPAVIELGGVVLGTYDKIGENGEIEAHYRNLEAKYVNSAKDLTLPHEASFVLEAVLQSSRLETAPQEDGDVVETGRTIAKILMLDDYRGYAKETELVIDSNEDQDGNIIVAQDFLEDIESGTVMMFYGNMVNKVIVKEEKIEVGFGQAQVKKEKKFVDEWQVHSLSQPYQGEMYEIETENLLEGKKKYVADLQIQASKRASQGSNATTAPKIGFGGNASPSPFKKASEGSGMTREAAKAMLDF